MISSSYLMLIVATLVIGMGAQWYVNHKLKTYSHVANSTGLTGAEAARQMLSYYGISNVQVFRGGPGQDYFDPRSNSVTLSPEALSLIHILQLHCFLCFMLLPARICRGFWHIAELVCRRCSVSYTHLDVYKRQVLGALRAIAALKIPCNVMGIIACAENMPSGSAQRPGDVVKACLLYTSRCV